MLIFISNTPRSYSWGSTDALPAMLGTVPNGEPQAELWLGDHPGGPASVAKATPVHQTLIELIAQDPERYGVEGGSLPFLLKLLAIGAPLSLQAHPALDQARAGYAAETAAGVPLTAPERNYRDANHKPELLVALSEVTALSGFRAVEQAVADIRALVSRSRQGSPSLAAAAELLRNGAPKDARRRFLEWAFAASQDVLAALRELRTVLDEIDVSSHADAMPAPEGALLPERLDSLRLLVKHHPNDPGVLVSLLLNSVRLAPGEAVFLGAGQLHAYLSGLAVEVMANSDNVLRAGLTEKHVDAAELLRLLDLDELTEPRLRSESVAPGLHAWRPGVRDFQLLRARLSSDREGHSASSQRRSLSDSPPLGAKPADTVDDDSPEITIEVEAPVVLIVTEGRVLVSRPAAELAELANVARGQSLYISSGEPIRLSGNGEAFLATVGQIPITASERSR